MLGWAEPEVVYITYGKMWFPVFVALALCSYVVDAPLLSADVVAGASRRTTAR
ncbi:MAG: hypothetical protein WKF73_05325 [Nocardioidaceae bacterium]